MPAFRLTAFSGEQPRIMPRLLPDMAATAAFDVRLEDGSLAPRRRSVQVADTDEPSHQTIYRHGSEWLSWPGTVHAAPGPVATDRLYLTGSGAPKMMVDDGIYDLAVPRPEDPLSVTLGGSGTGDVITRLYVYTWVTEFGEESEPSPASNAVNWQSGRSVTLADFAATPPDRGITHQRIYRSQQGRAGSYFYMIAERDASSGNYTDNVPIDAFQEPLPSANWNAPPADLVGLTALPNGIMAAFSGRDLYFCEPWRPHAWPETYVQTTDFPIVGLGALGGALIVLTTATPYLVTGTHPDSMAMLKIEANLPCVNARSIVDLGFALAYASHDGLVAVFADGSARLVTGNLFTPRTWQALNPQGFVSAQLNSRYVAFYNSVSPAGEVLTGGLFIDIGETPFLIRAAERVAAAYHDDRAGALFIKRMGSGAIHQFDSPEGLPATMYWRSKEIWLQQPDNMGVIRVEADLVIEGDEQDALDEERARIIEINEGLLAAGSIFDEINAGALNEFTFGGDILEPLPTGTSEITVAVFADDKFVASVQRTNVEVRLPSGFLARKWQIDVTGNTPITAVSVAKTIDELRSLPA